MRVKVVLPNVFWRFAVREKAGRRSCPTTSVLHLLTSDGCVCDQLSSLSRGMGYTYDIRRMVKAKIPEAAMKANMGTLLMKTWRGSPSSGTVLSSSKP